MECNFNTELKRLRKSKGITQEQLADKVGVSPQAVSKWEISSYPDAQLLPAIADALDVTIDELYGRGSENKMNIFGKKIYKTKKSKYLNTILRKNIVKLKVIVNHILKLSLNQ